MDKTTSKHFLNHLVNLNRYFVNRSSVFHSFHSSGVQNVPKILRECLATIDEVIDVLPADKVYGNYEHRSLILRSMSWCAVDASYLKINNTPFQNHKLRCIAVSAQMHGVCTWKARDVIDYGKWLQYSLISRASSNAKCTITVYNVRPLLYSFSHW